MSAARRVVVAACAVASLVRSAPAHGEATATDKAMAEALFQQGKELIKSGDAAAACPKLADSQRLDPQLGTLLFLATCHDEIGNTASAWAEFNAAIAQLDRVPQPERRRYAEEKIRDLEHRLSRVVLSTSQPRPDLEIRIDGGVIGAGSLGTPLPLDPGDHEISASLQRRSYWRTTVHLSGPSTVRVEIPPPAPEQAPVATAPAWSAERAPGPTSQYHTTAYVIGAFSLASVGIGAAFSVAALAKKSDADAHQCSGSFCTQAGLDDYASARTEAWVATAAFGVGVVGLAVGGYLLLKPRASAPAGAWIIPGPNGVSAGARW